LITGSLDHGRSGVQLIQEDDACAVSRQEARNCPLRPASFAEERQPSQIDGVEEKGTDIPEFKGERSCDLANNGGLPNTGSAPQEYGLARSDL
jgi:hypothetical protein